MHYIQQFDDATQNTSNTPQPQQVVKWKLPLANVYKINTDGGCNEPRKCSGIGVVIRDSNGQLIAALSTMIPLIYETDIVEAMALRSGIILAAEIGLHRVILESDAEKVIGPSDL